MTWSNIGTRPPVVVHSVVSPPVGGALVVSATTPTITGSTGSTGVVGLAGLTTTLTGPLDHRSGGHGQHRLRDHSRAHGGQLHPEHGAADGLRRRQREHDDRRPDRDRDRHPDQLLPAPTLAQPGTITASFQTTYSGATGATGATGSTTLTGPSDQFSIQYGGLDPAPRVRHRQHADEQLVLQHDHLGRDGLPDGHPFTGDYNAEPGGCIDPTVPTAGQVPVAVTAGQTATPTLPEPAMIILPYTSPPTTANWTPIDDPSNPPTVVYTGAATGPTRRTSPATT